MRPTTAQRTVDQWNAAHPVGTPIRYWPGPRDDGPGYTSVTRHPATVLAGVTPVAWPERSGGCVALTHVRVGHEWPPRRIQRQRTKGWRLPDTARYVGRPTKWGNPYRLGVAQTRTPAIDGGPWEFESRACGPGQHYTYPDKATTYHTIEMATADECVQMFRDDLLGTRSYWYRRPGTLTPDMVRQELAGWDLACWCPLTDADGNPVPCHADVLLAIAAGTTEVTP